MKYDTRSDAWMAELRRCVNAKLDSFLAEKRREAERLSPGSVELVDAIQSLTMRGGKRLRAAVLTAAYQAVRPQSTSTLSDVLAVTVDVCAAMEILQSYFLIHDDWMDGDAQRRGAPAVHAHFASNYAQEHLGAAIAILAGDLASVYAWELLVAAPFPPSRLAEALRCFVRIQTEVFFGQHLDLVGSEDVSRMHNLKTGSYTVRGPILLGGILADASDAQLQQLEHFAAPLGLAFQLRDDLLGTFGDAATMGKPAGNDLRVGKHTALMQAAKQRMVGQDREIWQSVWGNAAASDAQVEQATEALVRCGARAQVESELERLVMQSRQALTTNNAMHGAQLNDAGTSLLESTLVWLTERTQ